MNKREWEIELGLLETLRQQKEEQLEILEALIGVAGNCSNEREAIALGKCLDALELYEKQQFNAAMAKAKARGLVLH
jgi:hypothetical protein